MQAVQGEFFRELLDEVLGFAGAVIIRRILGIAHVIDFESIKDPDAR
jgi:5-methylthioribose kinase